MNIKNPWEDILTNLYRMLIIKPRPVILDIGTGFMINLELLLNAAPRESKIYSIDPSLEVMDNAEKRFKEEILRGRVVLKRASAEEIPLNDESLDYVTSAITFHHIEDKESALREVERVMRRDGMAIILDWGRRGSEYSPHTAEHLENSLNELRQLISKRFEVRLEKNFNDLFYFVVFTRKA
ncbi:MAG TPA: class I SAM-dependent methyltransferase [Candidatus Caldiarchaeum subterraneum]|uniref:Class I SAM-dependent methyltransferase n=1 Tax=Caldiarchaeum subterraneum TaxID=311458 RepID=A0A832ZZS5_CALS0|nr:class I SAM-dependent methyltransferase [Candidatus Caldarchaeum subterraneum]